MLEIKKGKSLMIRLLTLIPIAILVMLMALPSIPDTVAQTGSTQPNIGYDWYWKEIRDVRAIPGITTADFMGNPANFVTDYSRMQWFRNRNNLTDVYQRPQAHFTIERIDRNTGEVTQTFDTRIHGTEQASWQSPRGEILSDHWSYHYDRFEPFQFDHAHYNARRIEFRVGDTLRFTDHSVRSNNPGSERLRHNLQMGPASGALAQAIFSQGIGNPPGAFGHLQNPIGWPNAAGFFEVEITEDMILRNEDGSVKLEERRYADEPGYGLVYGQRLFYAVADRVEMIFNPISMLEIPAGSTTATLGGIGEYQNFSQNGNHFTPTDESVYGARLPGGALYHFQAVRIAILPDTTTPAVTLIKVHEYGSYDENGDFIADPSETRHEIIPIMNSQRPNDDYDWFNPDRSFGIRTTEGNRTVLSSRDEPYEGEGTEFDFTTLNLREWRSYTQRHRDPGSPDYSPRRGVPIPEIDLSRGVGDLDTWSTTLTDPMADLVWAWTEVREDDATSWEDITAKIGDTEDGRGLIKHDFIFCHKKLLTACGFAGRSTVYSGYYRDFFQLLCF